MYSTHASPRTKTNNKTIETKSWGATHSQQECFSLWVSSQPNANQIDLHCLLTYFPTHSRVSFFLCFVMVLLYSFRWNSLSYWAYCIFCLFLSFIVCLSFPPNTDVPWAVKYQIKLKPPLHFFKKKETNKQKPPWQGSCALRTGTGKDMIECYQCNSVLFLVTGDHFSQFRTMRKGPIRYLSVETTWCYTGCSVLTPWPQPKVFCCCYCHLSVFYAGSHVAKIGLEFTMQRGF